MKTLSYSIFYPCCFSTLHPERRIFYSKLINILDPEVQVVLLPRNTILAKSETPVILKCRASIRESWQNTVFYDDIFGSVVQFVSVDGFCNITVTNNLYKAKCNLTSHEFIVELQTAFQWYDGHDFKCVVQYGSGSRTTDSFIQDSTNIEITGRQLLLFEIGISLLKYKEMKLTGQLLSWFVTQMGFVYTFWK